MATSRTYSITLTAHEAAIVRAALTDAAKSYRKAAAKGSRKDIEEFGATLIDAWSANADICDHVARRLR